MKTIFKMALLLLFISPILFSSCYKETFNPPIVIPKPEPPTGTIPPFAPIKDSLSGRSFIFNDLIWQSWTGGNPDVNVELPDSHLFLNRGIEVSIISVIDTIEVPFYYVEFGLGVFVIPANKGFIYDNSYFDSIFLFAIGVNKNQLVGTTVSIKVKIL